MFDRPSSSWRRSLAPAFSACSPLRLTKHTFPSPSSSSSSCRTRPPPPPCSVQTLNSSSSPSSPSPTSPSSPSPTPTPTPITTTTTPDATPDATAEILREVQILHLTDSWVAVCKPPGVLMHRTKLYKTIRGEQYLQESVRRKVSEMLHRRVTIFPVHRLDRATSGVVLFGLDEARNAAMLQEALQCAKSACKQYWTLAFNGTSMPDTEWINDHPLKDLPSASGRRRQNRVRRDARTHFQRLHTFGDVAVIRATLHTGRRHQIRRHLSYGRFPIVGDTSHGDTALNHEAKELFRVERLCLHARRVAFTDPFTKKRVYLQMAVPQDLRRVVEALPGYSSELDHVLDLDDAPDLDTSVFYGCALFGGEKAVEETEKESDASDASG